MKYCKATRAKVACIHLLYGSHFPATQATYEVSQNKRKCLWNHDIYKGRQQDVDPVPFM